jgi:hypothetical protein
MKKRLPDLSLTVKSTALFIDLVKDAGNWNGNPLWGGNVGGSREDRGNLTDIKKAGLVTTDMDDGCIWIFFTDLGKKFAKGLGYEIEC